MSQTNQTKINRKMAQSLIFFAAMLFYGTLAYAAEKDMTVYKSPTCSCCLKWVKHMQRAGFNVTVVDQQNLTPIKRKLQITPQIQACHTAVVDGYFIEGHIPASTVKRFLAEKPKNAKGLAVPGMPLGSPGMEVPGRSPQPYAVLQINKDGRAQVYEQK